MEGESSNAEHQIDDEKAEKNVDDDDDVKTPQPPENWDRCHFFLKQKHRFCRQQPMSEGKLFCGNHQNLEVVEPQRRHEDFSAQNGDNNSTRSIRHRKRIPCPVDPSHMIYQDMMEKHIQICPKTKKRKRQELEKYFVENVNCGGYGQLLGHDDERVVQSSNSTSSSPMLSLKPGTSEWARRIALRVLQVHQSVFRHQDSEHDIQFRNEVDVSALTFQDIHNAIRMNDVSQPEIDAGISRAFQCHKIKSGGSRHTIQIASLIGHLRQMNVLSKLQQQEKDKQHSTSTTATSTRNDGSSSSNSGNEKRPLIFIDMGAGRGMFGLVAAGVACASGQADTHLIMVERTGSRSKADKAFRTAKPKSTNPADLSSYLKIDEMKWSRLWCDLSHIHLPVVFQGDAPDAAYNDDRAKIVVIAKHLCGAGTDLALKSMSSIRHRVNACILATCCHGICDWQHYVGRDYLCGIMEKEQAENNDEDGSSTGLKFGKQEFQLLCRWCAASVATVANNDNDRSDDSKNNNSDDMEHARCVAADDDDKNYLGRTTSNLAISISSVVCDLNLSCGIQGLGRACQSLIDYGRWKYLRNQIFAHKAGENAIVNLSHYVPPYVSPQNSVLWAYKVEEKQGKTEGKGARMEEKNDAT